MSYILMFYYNPLNPPFLRGTWLKIISLNSYDKSELHFKEYFIAIPVLKRLAYSYHYQNHDKKI